MNYKSYCFFSFKKPHKSGCGEDQTSSVVEHTIQVHAESKKVMYFA